MKYFAIAVANLALLLIDATDSPVRGLRNGRGIETPNGQLDLVSYQIDGRGVGYTCLEACGCDEGCMDLFCEKDDDGDFTGRFLDGNNVVVWNTVQNVFGGLSNLCTDAFKDPSGCASSSEGVDGSCTAFPPTFTSQEPLFFFWCAPKSQACYDECFEEFGSQSDPDGYSFCVLTQCAPEGLQGLFDGICATCAETVGVGSGGAGRGSVFGLPPSVGCNNQFFTAEKKKGGKRDKEMIEDMMADMP